MAIFTEDQKRRARQTDLYDYMISHHADAVTKEGDSLRLNANHSISIKRHYTGYLDFATGEKGNSIDFLVRHMGYGIADAVLALCQS